MTDLEIDRLLRSWWSGLDASALPSEQTIYLITRFARFLLDAEAERVASFDDPLD